MRYRRDRRTVSHYRGAGLITGCRNWLAVRDPGEPCRTRGVDEPALPEHSGDAPITGPRRRGKGRDARTPPRAFASVGNATALRVLLAFT